MSSEKTRWFQGDLTLGGRCDVLEGNHFRNKGVAVAETPEIAARIVRDHNAAEMTAREFSTAITAFEKSIGPRASVSTFLSFSGAPLYASVYTTGDYSKGADFAVQAETFAELLEATTTKWAEYEVTHRTRTIRKMALAIIRITGELGHCTDAALRNCGEFDPDQVKAFGEQACADANEIAGKGPFTIVAIGGANAEAA